MPRFTSCLLACLCVGLVSCNPILVSVQSKSQEEMDALTAAVDIAAETQYEPGQTTRTTLGVIEATMSRVVDVNDPYVTTKTASVPTWGMLQDITYNSETNIWTFQYQTMRIDSGTSLNQFHRVLYFTKKDTDYVQGDTGNACLVNGVSVSDCLSALHTNYLMSETPVNENADYIAWHDTEFNIADPIVVTQQPVPYSLLETVTIQIPQKRIRDSLGKSTTYTHATEGLQKQWTFGIGMLFHGVGSNVVVFDNFNLIENSFDQLAISRSNSYALARYVTFWTNEAAGNANIRVAHIEYVLDEGYEVLDINASVNGQVVSQSDCSDMQALVTALDNNGQCITRRDLCVPDVYETTPSCVGCVAYVVPLPQWAVSPFKINTLLTLKNTQSNAEILSTLNFETSNMQTVCKDAVYSTFNAIDHVQATLYRGYSLQAQVVQGSFTVQNDTALGLPETLLTLVLTPKDAAAVSYFTEFSNQHINLDELYISHSLFASVVEEVQPITNQVIGTGDGRTTLNIDAELLSQCKLESDATFEWDSSAQCVTTQDWGLSGPIVRDKSSPTLDQGQPMYFVHEVNLASPASATYDWLSTNIFAGSTDSANTFLQNTRQLVPAEQQSMSKAYYVFPIYQWPDQSPIGLKDTSVVSFAWSVSEFAGVGRRRLLSVPLVDAFRIQSTHNKLRSTPKHRPRRQITPSTVGPVHLQRKHMNMPNHIKFKQGNVKL